jgi:hypothetical protein
MWVGSFSGNDSPKSYIPSLRHSVVHSLDLAKTMRALYYVCLSSG